MKRRRARHGLPGYLYALRSQDGGVMSWRDELSPLHNRQGWAGAILMVALFCLPGLMGDGPEDRAAYDRAARELMTEEQAR